mmetsp:Transcript_6135/g.18520  ORF Transcript_6135/g.18520 Transcript_6135/m.18520 type:complete len:353 (-) Transcript_6135:30-1088(-)
MRRTASAGGPGCGMDQIPYTRQRHGISQKLPSWWWLLILGGSALAAPVPVAPIIGGKDITAHVSSLDDFKNSSNTLLPYGKVGAPRPGDVALVINHNQKAGGSTIKNMIISICVANRWYCDNLLQESWLRWSPVEKTSSLSAWFEQPPSERGKTKVVFSSIGIFLGICKFLHRPCVYFTTIRAPMSHLWSNYHYYCTMGAEHQRKWTEEEKKVGRCTTPVDQWRHTVNICSRLGSGKVEQSYPGDITSAVAAMSHPCMWMFDTDTLNSDLAAFGRRIGPPFDLDFEKRAAANVHHILANSSNYFGHIHTPISPEVESRIMATTLSSLARCYSAYRSFRADMWDRPASPLVTC